MIGGQDLSKYLINFNSADWANTANAQLQAALKNGMQYSEKYTQQAVDAAQQYNNQAQQQMQGGFNQAQAVNAPQQLATYGALDKYQDLLGIARPVGGSAQLAGGLLNQAQGQPNTPWQQQQSAGYNQGLFNNQPGGY